MSGTIPTDEELENPVPRYGLLLCVVLYCLIISLLTSLFSSSFLINDLFYPFLMGQNLYFYRFIAIIKRTVNLRNHFHLKRMADDSLFLIDIDKILQTKAPKHLTSTYQSLSSPICKRIVHQEELNVFCAIRKDKVGVDFLGACLEFLDAKLEVKGLGKYSERRFIYVRVQSSTGRTGRCFSRIYFGTSFRWEGEVSGE